MTVTLSAWSNVIIALAAATNLLIAIGLIVLAFKLKGIIRGTVDDVLDKTLPKVQPVLDNVSHVTGQVSEIVEKVSPRVVQIADESEDTVHSVTTKVKTTSNLVTENVARPIVNIASLLTGVQKGLEVWQTAKTSQADGNGKEEVLVVETVDPAGRP